MEFQVAAYPVPATDAVHFQVDAPEAGLMDLEVFDLQGKRVALQSGVLVEAGSAATLTVDVAGWNSGIYFARVSHAVSGVQTLKFSVVNR